ncbi:MAG: hypothetical protein ACRC62_39295 [Microcoleus sp.]
MSTAVGCGCYNSRYTDIYGQPTSRLGNQLSTANSPKNLALHFQVWVVHQSCQISNLKSKIV